MNNQTKLEFRLVPTKGVASGKGFRAEWTRKNEVIDMDAVIAEAQAKGAFWGVSAGRARSDIETLFDTMIENVLKDGRTRKLDGYLELSLKIHGNFAERTDDFDPERNTLDLGIRPLSAFRQEAKGIQPVNVNRIKQFRLSYITAADGQHKNHEVVFGQEFVIRGSNLTLPTNGFSGIFCQVHVDGNVWACAEAPILEKSDSEIRCAWPEDYGPEVLRHTLWVSVTKGYNIEANPPDVDRTAHAGILPPTAD